MKKFYAAAALLLATVGMNAAESLPYNHASVILRTPTGMTSVHLSEWVAAAV